MMELVEGPKGFWRRLFGGWQGRGIMDLGEIVRILGPTVATLVGPTVRKAALYMFYNRNREGRYDDHFRELLALARTDLQQMRANVKEILDLCQRFNIDIHEPGGVYRIDIRLDPYLASRQRRVQDKLQHLANEFRGSIDDIENVIACLNGLTSEGSEGVTQIEAPGYYESESVQDLASAEAFIREMMANPELDIATLINTVDSTLESCDAVLQEFTEGIDVGRPSQR